MAITVNIILQQFPMVPEGFNENLDGLLLWMTENAQFNAEGTFLAGQINGPAPTSNIGIWFDGRDIKLWDTGESAYKLSNTVPIGGVMEFAGENLPEYFLDCDGSYISRNTYADLFAAIGTKHNKSTDVDVTKFRLPDCRGRMVVGAGKGDYDVNGSGAVVGRMIEHLLGETFGSECIYRSMRATDQPVALMMKYLSQTLAVAMGGGENLIGQYESVAPPAIALTKIIRYK
jgi:hypothetical protein